jgi:cytochrome c biogenesis protein CcmG, thiol:disulfide interchange protein DsbE
MMGPRAVALAVVFSWFGPGAVVAQSGETAPDTAARAGAVAPDITLVNLAGDTARLAALRGHPVVVNFWATWCGPCKGEMPLLVEAYARHMEADLHLLAVNLTDQESLGDVRKFVDTYHVPFSVPLDRKGKVRRAYALRGVPTSVFIDRHGLVRSVHTGPLTADTLESRLNDILTPR